MLVHVVGVCIWEKIPNSMVALLGSAPSARAPFE
jgi:hypothetical protein